MLGLLIDRLLFYFYFRRRYKKIFLNYGENVRWGKHFRRLTIPSSVRISCPEKISIGNNCQIDEFVYLQCHKEGDGIFIGNGTRCNAFTHILSFSRITINNNVLIAPFCLITSGNHGFQDKNAPIMSQPHLPAGEITIHEGSWLGQGSKILGGVTLGKNNVVAAGSTVLKAMYDDYSVLAGTPAKKVK